MLQTVLAIALALLFLLPLLMIIHRAQLILLEWARIRNDSYHSDRLEG